MARCTGLLLASIAPLLLGSDCAGAACPPAPPPMSAARAKEIAPTIETGLAVSTTHVFGDCRLDEAAAPTSSCNGSALCARERQPLRVLVSPINVSIPIAGDCDPAIAVEDASARAVYDGRASDQGELVVALEPGQWVLHMSADDRCARCAVADDGGPCTIDVASGRLTVRDLVLDRSTR